MVGERIDTVINTGEFDQVLFLGKRTIELHGFVEMIPGMESVGNPKTYCDVTAFRKRWGGLKFEEINIRSIDTDRICTQPVNIGGKRTLVIAAELNSIDKNFSFIDYFTREKDIKILEFKREHEFMRQQMAVMLGFIREHSLEEDFKEHIQNMINHYKTNIVRLTPRTSEVPPISVEMGQKEQKKED